MRILTAVTCIYLFALSSEAAELFGPYRATVMEVVDGDTVRLNVHIWPKLFEKTLFRIAGVDTPEIHGKAPDCEKATGKAAKEFTEKFLSGAETVVISDVKLEKYGRASGFSKKLEALSVEASSL